MVSNSKSMTKARGYGCPFENPTVKTSHGTADVVVELMYDALSQELVL